MYRGYLATHGIADAPGQVMPNTNSIELRSLFRAVVVQLPPEAGQDSSQPDVPRQPVVYGAANVI